MSESPRCECGHVHHHHIDGGACSWIECRCTGYVSELRVAEPEHIRAFDNIPDLLPLTLAQRAEIAHEAKQRIIESRDVGMGDWYSLAKWATVVLTYEQMLRSVIAEANRVDMQAKAVSMSPAEEDARVNGAAWADYDGQPGTHVREEHHVDKDGHVVTRWNSDE